MREHVFPIGYGSFFWGSMLNFIRFTYSFATIYNSPHIINSNNPFDTNEDN